MDLFDSLDPTLFAENPYIGDIKQHETHNGTMSTTMDMEHTDWIAEEIQTISENTFSTTDTEWDMEVEPPNNEYPDTYNDHNQSYMCYPLSQINKNHLEAGNKIILPPSVLDELAYRSNVVYPMVFCIMKPDSDVHSHCGVIEFTADEGIVYMPKWMMENMKLKEGDIVDIENTSLLQGTYVKLQPHATKFTMLSDHKSLLEKAFGDFACLTTGDTIVVNHEGEKYLIDIVETKPSDHAISLFDTDCEVDFATPLDYKEPEKKTMIFTRDGESVNQFMKKLMMKESNVANKQQTEFSPFMGQARRVNGQVVAAATEVKEDDRSKVQLKKEPEVFKAFTGKSFRLM
ncbi:ubiquitin fusion degradation protein UFD1 [Artemisia annua]|uniref:Ubiquitin fusion degradation protein UFD1 n=1 Tax=Artemisia annua TaxID=35608 RepID=A0A2U1NF54_ARTAN|nr:ubiquitin fusion degradation protein UFD1 [Artemisia annua]